MDPVHRLANVQAVIFDVYGTIAEVREKRHPFRQLLKIGKRQGRTVCARDLASIISAPLGLNGAANLLGIELTSADLAHLERELTLELASIRLFPESIDVLQLLQEKGFKLGLCSNLAADYARPITSLLPFKLSSYTWSFESGTVKPDPAIYTKVCVTLNCVPSSVLMIGDSVAADVNGPRRIGMQSLHLNRLKTRDTEAVSPSMTTLTDVFEFL